MTRSRVFSGGPVEGIPPVSEVEFLAYPEKFRVCAKCGTPMRNLNDSPIRQVNPPFWKTDRWYCTKCKTQSYSGMGPVRHPGIQDPQEEDRNFIALNHCLENEPLDVQLAYADFLIRGVECENELKGIKRLSLS